MKIATFTCAAIAALAAASAAVPALAQPYGGYDERNPCQQQQHNSGTTGALLGGVAGAAIGNGVTHGGGRLGGTVIGGVAGAVIGNNIARGSAKNSDACQEQGYYEQQGGYRGQPQGYYAQGGYRGQPQGYYDQGGYRGQPQGYYDQGGYRSEPQRGDDGRYGYNGGYPQPYEAQPYPRGGYVGGDGGD